MTPDTRLAIQISKLEFRYGSSDFCLRVPELSIPRGTSTAAIGPSGSGKTTLLQLMAGILVPSLGTVTVGGHEVSQCDEAERRDFRIRNLGLIFQEFELLDHLNVLDNMLLTCRVTSAIRLQRGHFERARELAEQVGLDDKLGRYMRQLSQGERQRVALCRALLLRPSLLLCDEPTGNLDPASKQQVIDLLLSCARDCGTTLFVVTHDHALLPRFDQTIDFEQLGSLDGAEP